MHKNIIHHISWDQLALSYCIANRPYFLNKIYIFWKWKNILFSSQKKEYWLPPRSFTWEQIYPNPLVQWLGCWIPNPGLVGSKPLGFFKADWGFCPSECGQVSTMNSWVLAVKSKLSSPSGYVSLICWAPSIKRGHNIFVSYEYQSVL